MNIFRAVLFLFLSSQIAIFPCFADRHTLSDNTKIAKKHGWHDCYQFGSSGFSTNNPENWYPINTVSYPAVVPLSQNQNVGFTKGDIHLKSNGIKVGKSGNYWVSFSAILLNNDINVTPLIPIFLVKNGIFNITSTSTLSAVQSLAPGIITHIQGSGLLKNLKRGTKLSLVATNGGSPTPQTVLIVSWNISLFRIPCNSEKRCH